MQFEPKLSPIYFITAGLTGYQNFYMRRIPTHLVDLAGGEGGPVPAAVVQAPHPVGDEGARAGSAGR